MDSKKRILVAVFVLAVGFGIAWMFRKQYVPSVNNEVADSAVTFMSESDTDEESSSEPKRQGVPLPTPFDAGMPTPPPLESPPPSAEPSPSVLEPPPLAPVVPPKPAVAPAESTPPTIRRSPALPSIPTVVEEEPEPPNLVEIKANPFSNRSALPPEQPVVKARPKPKVRPAKPPSEYRVHTIVNGDSLSRISQRYLGNAERFMEVYELNRGVLLDPDVLPIGQQIRIPQVAAAGRASDILYRPVTTDTSPAVPTTPKLVPLPPGALPSSR